MRTSSTRPVLAVALAALFAVGAGAGCARSAKPDSRTDRVEGTERGERAGRIERGRASWYGARFQGRKTASGERFDKNDLTAAHRTRPFDSCVRVLNLENGRTADVRINDRGPWARSRIIDVSEAAGRKLGMLHDGTVPVELGPCD